MDWESFQEIVGLLLPSRTANLNLTADQIELTIEGYSVVCTKQEFDSINSRYLDYTSTPTYICTSKEMEIIIDPVESRVGLRLQSEPLTIRDDTVAYTLSAPSNELLLSFLSLIPRDEIRDYRRLIPARHIIQRFELNGSDEISLFDLLKRVVRISFSLKISIIDNTPVDIFIKHANAFLFNLAYNTGCVFKLVGDISNLSIDRGYITHRRLLRADEMEPPKLFYNFELIEQYNLALSSNDAFIKFIAYYHIMEHFFDDVYSGSLISGVKEIMTNPGFSTKKPKEISKVIDFVQKKTKLTKDAFQGTELEALELTIKTFIQLDVLYTALHEYDPSLINYYKMQEVSFSKGDTFDLSDYANEKLPKKIAARIYKTRNSLVHNKSNTTRVKERGLYHPFTDDKELNMEIPLMRIIAETIIVRTAAEI